MWLSLSVVTEGMFLASSKLDSFLIPVGFYILPKRNCIDLGDGGGGEGELL